MKRVCALVVVLSMLATSAPAPAQAYERVAKRGAFATFLSQLRDAAKRHDDAALARLTGPHFTVGEEADREASLGDLSAHPQRLAPLVRIVEKGACYRTGPRLVQCELPDPGPDLDHTGIPIPVMTIAIFSRTRAGWRLSAYYAE